MQVGITATQRRDLMEIVEERYDRGSTMITSQLPIKAWHDVIGKPTFADAILDRLATTHIVSSWRGNPCGKPSPKLMTKCLKPDIRNPLPHGNASQAGE